MLIGGSYAGAADLHWGLGLWEFACTAVGPSCASHGLTSYGGIGLVWLLSMGWDVRHHLSGTPLVPVVPSSSVGWTICAP